MLFLLLLLLRNIAYYKITTGNKIMQVTANPIPGPAIEKSDRLFNCTGVSNYTFCRNHNLRMLRIISFYCLLLPAFICSSKETG